MLFNPNDRAQLTSAIQKVINHPLKATIMVKNGKNTYLNSYSELAFIERFKTGFTTLIQLSNV